MPTPLALGAAARPAPGLQILSPLSSRDPAPKTKFTHVLSQFTCKSDSGRASLARARWGEADELAAHIESAADLQELGSFNAIINKVPRVRVLVLAEQVRGLAAVVQCWNAGKKCYEEKVDFATRQKCSSWIAGYADGLPPQTNFNVNANATPQKPRELDDLTPAGIEALQRVLDRARSKLAAGTEPKKVTPM